MFCVSKNFCLFYGCSLLIQSLLAVNISGNLKKKAFKGKDCSVVLRVFQLACTRLNKENKKAVCNFLDTAFSMIL